MWNWLPAFRVVAETEHLPTASEQLHISPSALSRSVRLLEEEVGQALFHRVGRNLKLNDAGEVLLAAIRDSMRRIDEGLSIAKGARYQGPVHLSATEGALPLIEEATFKLLANHPDLTVHISSPGRDDVATRLLTGRLDLAILDEKLEHNRLESVPLLTLENGIYVDKSHPLAKGFSAKLLEETAFVAPQKEDAHAPKDPWPSERVRKVKVTFTRFDVAASLVRQGEVAVCLPDALAKERYSDLVRVGFEGLAKTELFAWRRPALVAGDKTDVVLDVVREAMGLQPDREATE